MYHVIVRGKVVFLRARPASFAETIAPFGIADIHGSNQGNLFCFEWLDNN
jgi:hypothetical protein